MKIVASNNSFVYDELGGDGFRLVTAETVIVSSGEEALEVVRTHNPDLVVLDADLPEINGYEVCRAIKADKDLKEVRVILVHQGAISTKQLRLLANSGCDDVLVYRVPGETLYHRAARILGLPDPSLARPVALRVALAGDQVSESYAHATHLSTRGVDLLVDPPLTEGAELTLRLGREGSESGLEVSGLVTSSGTDRASGSSVASVEFHSLSLDQRAELADLALWDVKRLANGIRIALRGEFNESTDFSRIPVQSESRVVFDLSGLRLINSWGARQWIMFLRSLPDELSYCFVDAAPVFVKQCNMVSDMIGCGEMLSFAAPYVCYRCGGENHRILQSSAMSEAVVNAPPEFRCPACGGNEVFEDVPGRYFAFLGFR